MFFPVIPLNTQAFSRISGKFFTKNRCGTLGCQRAAPVGIIDVFP